ncbi:MAG: hypothetical protein ACK5NB_03915 [Flavobacteriaceae bacterium]
MNTKTIKHLLIGLSIIAIAFALKKPFNFSNHEVFLMLGVGVLLAAIHITATSALNFISPSDWFFKNRFKFFSLARGAMYGIVYFSINTILENSTFSFKKALVTTLVCALLGLILDGFFFSKSKKPKTKNRTFSLQKQLATDFAALTDQNGKNHEGKLILTDKALIFVDNKTQQKLIDQSISNITPTISNSIIKSPNGFKIGTTEIKNLMFPFY